MESELDPRTQKCYPVPATFLCVVGIALYVTGTGKHNLLFGWAKWVRTLTNSKVPNLSLRGSWKLRAPKMVTFPTTNKFIPLLLRELERVSHHGVDAYDLDYTDVRHSKYLFELYQLCFIVDTLLNILCKQMSTRYAVKSFLLCKVVIIKHA